MDHRSPHPEVDLDSNNRELVVCLSKEVRPDYHAMHLVQSVQNEIRNSCKVIQTIDRRYKFSFKHKVPFEWLTCVDTNLMCLGCSFCIQSNVTTHIY